MASAADDFAGPADDPPSNGRSSSVIPFPNLRANPRLAEAWAIEIEKANAAGHTKYRFPDPIAAAADLARVRKLAPLAWPVGWNEIGKRSTLYAGECIGIVGPTSGGKTSFAIQLALANAALGTPILWAPLELSPGEIDLRIVANMTATHFIRVREEWTDEQLAHQLYSITDVWRYVDKFIEPEAQLDAMRVAIRIAKKIYHRPPLLVADYIGKLASLERDPKVATRAAAERLRVMAVEEECFIAILSQTSRGNTGALTGKTEIEVAADAVGLAMDASEIEHACRVMLALQLFKQDDAAYLHSHVLASKTNTGLEGREGFRFDKPGGVWTELDYLPSTPTEDRKNLAAAKKDKSRVGDAPTIERVRNEFNLARAGDADAMRRKHIREALTRAGVQGMSKESLRRARGTGRAQRMDHSLQEMERAGDVEKLHNGRWRIVTRSNEP